MKTMLDVVGAVKTYTDSKVSLDPKETIIDYSGIISIADALPIAAKDVKLKVDAVQDLHGYTKPWVGGAGDNLLLNDSSTETKSGVTFTVDSTTGIVTLSNSLNSSYTVKKINTTGFYGKNGTTYYLKGGVSNDCYINVYNSSQGIDVNDKGSGATFTPSSDGYFDVQIVLQGNGTNFNGKVIKPMITTNSSAVFSPYTNICPITGHSQAKVTRAGKDLFKRPLITDNGTVATVSYTVDKAKGTYTFNGTATSTSDFTIWPRTLSSDNMYLPVGDYVYAIYDDKNKLLTDDDDGFRIYVGTTAGGSFSRISQNSNNGWNPFSITEDTASDYKLSDGSVLIAPYIYVIKDKTYINKTVNFRIFKADTIENFTIDLDGTRYGGVLDVTSGVLTVKSEIVLGSQLTNVGRTTSYTVPFFYGSISGSKNSGSLISSDFETIDPHDAPTFGAVAKNGQMCKGAFSTQIFIRDDRYTSVSDFQTAIASAQFVYELATPQTIQLTAEEVRLLLGYNTLFADTGDIQLTYQPATFGNIVEEVGELEEALTDEAETRAALGAHNLCPFDMDYIRSSNTSSWSGNTYTQNGTSFTYTNGTVTVANTPSAMVSPKYALFSLPAGEYILSGCPTGGSDTTYNLWLGVRNAADTTWTETYKDYGNGVTFTVYDDTPYVRIETEIRTGYDGATKVFKPMIRLAADSDPTYQPYAMTNKELTDSVNQLNDRVQFKTATLAANATQVIISDIPTSGNNLIEFFTSVPGLDYTDISVSGTSITLTYEAQTTNTTVYAMITKM